MMCFLREQSTSLPRTYPNAALAGIGFDRRRLVVFLAGLLLCGVSKLHAQNVPEAVIRQDRLWEGEIIINRDVTIEGVTVRVAPGTTIRFTAAKATGPAPVLRLKSPVLGSAAEAKTARLILAGSASQPIVVETPPALPGGSILCEPGHHGTIVATHALFRRLGVPMSEQKCQPAIYLELTAAADELSLSDCRFEQCGPVHGDFFGPAGGTQITRCTFTGTRGGITLLLTGSGSGRKTVLDNLADAALRIDCPQVLLRDNVLIGESAAIAVPSLSKEAITIDRNYVHCTATQDVGRYALKCDAPAVQVTGNVLVGGTYCLASAPRQVIGNVLIGVGGLQASFKIPDLRVQGLKSATMTHYLLTGLPAGAAVRGNLFLGPAYAAIAIGGNEDRPRIENNLFDGWDSARRAIHFNLLAGKPRQAVVLNNVFTRYRQSPIFDAAKLNGTIAQAGGNVFAGGGPRAYENIVEIKDLAPGDRRFGGFSELALQGAATTRAAADVDERLRKRQSTVAQVREAWFSLYRPRSDSPLHAGQAQVGPNNMP